MSVFIPAMLFWYDDTVYSAQTKVQVLYDSNQNTRQLHAFSFSTQKEKKGIAKNEGFLQYN